MHSSDNYSSYYNAPLFSTSHIASRMIMSNLRATAGNIILPHGQQQAVECWVKLFHVAYRLEQKATDVA